MAEVDDDELLAAWAGGDERSGTVLFDRYFRPISRFFYNKVEDGAEDLIQQTFLGLVEARSRFRGEGSFRSFVFAVAHNILRMHLRAKHKDAKIDFGTASVMDLCPRASSVLAEKREQQLLIAALRSVSLDDQVVLELFYIEEMSGTEIAAALELPEGTVRSRVRRARMRLQEAAGRLAASPEAISSTFSDLEGWAASLRVVDPAVDAR